MKRLPLLIDDQTSFLVRVGIWALVPVVFVALLPILLLLVIALYFSAIFHGVRVVVMGVGGKRSPAEFERQGPHFLEMQSPVQALTDQSSHSKSSENNAN